MTRRTFMRAMAGGLGAALLAGRMAGSGGRAAAAVDAAPRLGLREMAAARLHHGGERFVNPFGGPPRGRFGRLLQWKLFSPNRFKEHYAAEPTAPVRVDWRRVNAMEGLSLTFIKHAGLMIRDRGQTLLVDPIFGGLLPLIRDFSPLAFEPRELPPADHVLITHGHYDHLDLESLEALGGAPHYIAPPGYDALLVEAGALRLSRLDWFDTWRGDGLEVTLLPCNHWTMRNPLAGPNTGLWGSYLIRTRSGATLYISGDTGFFDGFDQLGGEYAIDLAIFNLGAYEPRWFMAPSHMSPEETVRAFGELKARHLAVVHWGTFRLGDEPVHLPPQEIQRVLESQGLGERLIDWRHGGTIRYGRSLSGADFELLPGSERQSPSPTPRSPPSELCLLRSVL
jgi:L-ascorbate metabolism protein UlaG (beta-lactamase superfamily)